MRYAFAMVACLLFAGAHAGAIERSTRGLPELGPPPQGEAQWVARSMRHNGLPMTLKSFHSRLSADGVLRHYETQTKHGSTRESMRSRRGAWQVLAILEARFFITIHARDLPSGSIGTIVVTAHPGDDTMSLATRFPLPPTLHIVNLQQYEDEGERAEHISLLSPRAPHLEAFSCAQLLRRKGWRLIQDAPAATIERGHVIEAQKGTAHARLTFMPDRSGVGGTAIVIVWKKV